MLKAYDTLLQQWSILMVIAIFGNKKPLKESFDYFPSYLITTMYVKAFCIIIIRLVINKCLKRSKYCKYFCSGVIMQIMFVVQGSKVNDDTSDPDSCINVYVRFKHDPNNQTTTVSVYATTQKIQLLRILKFLSTLLLCEVNTTVQKHLKVNRTNAVVYCIIWSYTLGY